MVGTLIAILVALGHPASQPGPLVVYDKEGGVAGIREQLTVARDGRATLRDGYGDDAPARRFRLTAAQLDHLRGVLEAAHLQRVRSSSGPGGCADCFGYEIRFGGVRVIAYENAIAPALAQPIALLDRLVARGSSAPAGTR